MSRQLQRTAMPTADVGRPEACAPSALGDGLLLLASLSWSAYGVRSRRSSLPPAVRAAAVAVLSAAAFVPVYALLPGKTLLGAGAGELAAQALVQGVLVGAVSIFVYTRAVALLGAAETALFAAAVPGITTLAAVPLLGEIPTRAAMAGLGIVTVGMWIALVPGAGRALDALPSSTPRTAVTAPRPGIEPGRSADRNRPRPPAHGA